MASPRRSEGLSFPMLLAVDALSSLLTAGPAAVAWGAVALYLRRFWGHPHFVVLLLPVPFLASLALIFTLAALRLFSPSLRKGVYPLGLNRGMIAWYCNLALNRAVRASGLWPMINSLYLLKFLYFRALGANIAYGANISLFVTLVDLPLITIGAGSTLGENVHISCHTFVGNKLLLKPVTIGRNVFVGTGCLIGPASQIGDDAWVGMSNFIASDRVPEGAKVADFEWEHGNPTKAP